MDEVHRIIWQYLTRGEVEDTPLGKRVREIVERERRHQEQDRPLGYFWSMDVPDKQPEAI